MPILSAMGGGSVRGVGFYSAIPELFTFTSHTFTAGTNFQRTGDSLATFTSAYSATSWASNTTFFNLFNSTLGFQRFQIPASTEYRIRVAGAAGGPSSNIITRRGWGAVVEGVVGLTAGQYLVFVVGKQPYELSISTLGGGGGGSFVWLSTDGTSVSDLLFAAGGGACSYASISTTTNLDGALDVRSRDAIVDPSNTTFVYQGNGQGGRTWDAGGGAGWLSGGNVGGQVGTGTGVSATAGGSTPIGTWGRSRADGFIGGTNNQTTGVLTGEGGFGGGGGGHSGANGGGGGGGYTGGRGGAGTGNPQSSGYGGGSFIKTTGVTSVATSDGTWNGLTTFNGVTITNLNLWADTVPGYVTVTKL